MTNLNCSYPTSGTSDLKSLDISDCISLKELYCDKAGITSLDISNNQALTILDCHDCEQLTSLTVGGCAALTELTCYGTALTSLDVSNCKSLKNLYCSLESEKTYNLIEDLNASGCTALEHLDCYGGLVLDSFGTGNTTWGSLQNLDLSGCSNLKYLNCADNELTSLNLSDCHLLSELNCSSNSLEILDLSGYTSLTKIDCSGNRLADLKLDGCTSLLEIDCSGNNFYETYLLEQLEFKDCPALTTFIHYGRAGNGAMKCFRVDLSNNPNLTTVEICRESVDNYGAHHVTCEILDITLPKNYLKMSQKQRLFKGFSPAE